MVVVFGRVNQILCQQNLLEWVLQSVRHRQISHTYTQAFMHTAAGACHPVVGEVRTFDRLTHTHTHTEKESGVLLCKVSCVTQVTFQVFVLEA